MKNNTPTKMKYKFALLSNLLEALKVRKIRNKCRNSLHNNEKISFLKQVIWYFFKYPKSHYRIWVVKKDNTIYGYGAFRTTPNGLMPTVCVDPKYRGGGIGRFIAKNLIKISKRENKSIIADENTSKYSKKIREAFGLIKSVEKNGIIYYDSQKYDI